MDFLDVECAQSYQYLEVILKSRTLRPLKNSKTIKESEVDTVVSKLIIFYQKTLNKKKFAETSAHNNHHASGSSLVFRSLSRLPRKLLQVFHFRYHEGLNFSFFLPAHPKTSYIHLISFEA